MRPRIAAPLTGVRQVGMEASRGLVGPAEPQENIMRRIATLQLELSLLQAPNTLPRPLYGGQNIDFEETMEIRMEEYYEERNRLANQIRQLIQLL